jgi:UPF0716 family protein affecting phage T7 exclusion
LGTLLVLELESAAVESALVLASGSMLGSGWTLMLLLVWE